MSNYYDDYYDIQRYANLWSRPFSSTDTQTDLDRYQTVYQTGIYERIKELLMDFRLYNKEFENKTKKNLKAKDLNK